MGALTLKTFSDELREWELIESEGFDITDSFGTSLRLSINNQQIILAEPFDPANPWITDRARLFFDGFFSKKSFQNPCWGSFFNDILSFVTTYHLSWVSF